ncbi:MAG TPA: SH3 domain-containing protein [Luteolibacter sp.]|nr:SH3 domain-containing protein [Luteolibacter sp.]
MPHFTANADYEEKDSQPLRLKRGDIVRTGPADHAWPGWVWAADDHGCSGYVPQEILEKIDDDRAKATDAFDPTVLTIRRGNRLESLRQIHGWHWCRNEHGAQGWVAGYLLRPL